MTIFMKCQQCRGKGYLNGEVCDHCSGDKVSSVVWCMTTETWAYIHGQLDLSPRNWRKIHVLDLGTSGWSICGLENHEDVGFYQLGDILSPDSEWICKRCIKALKSKKYELLIEV